MFRPEHHTLQNLHCKIFTACKPFLTAVLLCKILLLYCPLCYKYFQAIKSYNPRKCQICYKHSSLSKGQDRQFLFTYSIQCCESLLCCQTNTLTVAEYSAVSFLCAFKSNCKVGVMLRRPMHFVCHTKTRFIYAKQGRSLYTHIKQIATKKVSSLQFTRSRIKYLVECAGDPRAALSNR
jgi:hypothetical protein